MRLNHFAVREITMSAKSKLHIIITKRHIVHKEHTNQATFIVVYLTMRDEMIETF